MERLNKLESLHTLKDVNDTITALQNHHARKSRSGKTDEALTALKHYRDVKLNEERTFVDYIYGLHHKAFMNTVGDKWPEPRRIPDQSTSNQLLEEQKQHQNTQQRNTE